ncbi:MULTISPECIES: helix-turn-helix transcriptional regulator [Streptomyces]|uniref:Helix-turn-helix transcriptional regulator n=1 Tax=Streptomyces koelreuteriae TaxID=2838015 RepID=A0ABX8FT65_9ACTN|nr:MULTISPECIES: helix-turn-helix transcriptional regulator [Streptomyces]QWB24197.1 helix-turn-helix transcriptional regulator [Streptomyces koelreuteriae]UUA07189.1 helix-turn-helix transcriptional regulator [Streptomyces koelreuteriae]UUA14818.1 helix-turn-helix transcriptional regulator [Streptomyces sp. CRCS-T-1]
MSIADRRRALGLTQEGFAFTVGVDRRTVGRWERGESRPQPPQRPKVAEVLQMDLEELDALLTPSDVLPKTERLASSAHHAPGDPDEMIRREFLRHMAVSGAVASIPTGEAEALKPDADGFERMNGHLWQVYQLARAKHSVYPVVQSQLTALNNALRDGRAPTGSLCIAAGELFQLAGELAFDSNRYHDATASYSLAASASKEAGAYDLWACALIRNAYVDLSERRYRLAAETLGAARRIAQHGDGSLATKHWAAAVQAEAFAWLGDFDACEEALDEAEKVAEISGQASKGGWLRFDGSRLAEERGARYLQLNRLGLAETALKDALKLAPLAAGHSFRRRGAVLVDLAAIGAKRKDPEQVMEYGLEALRLARDSGSGYVARRLQSLTAELGTIGRDPRIAQLKAEIGTLTA